MEQRYYKHKIENLLVIGKIVTIHYFEFDKNFVGPTEAHDFWELVYADKKSVICSADNKEQTLQAGELLFHKPNETHALRADGVNAPNVFIVSFECKSESMRFFENKKTRLTDELSRLVYEIIRESKTTFDLPYSDPSLKKMKLLGSPSLGGQQLIKNYLEILLISLMRGETEKQDSEIVFLPKEELGERVANSVIAYLKEHVLERIGISDVCENLHYNKSYLFEQFKRATKMPIMAYFMKLKIERAKLLLRETELSVSQIAETLAFDSPNYFSKAFKKATGRTPLQYKKTALPTLSKRK